MRCERAIRDVSPHCHSLRRVWLGGPHLLERIAELMSTALMQLVKVHAQPPPVEAALGRLLVSCAASALKASQMPGIEPAGRDSFLIAIDRLHDRLSMRCWAPALSALLLPRIASAVGLCSGPTALTEAAMALSAVTSESFLFGLQLESHLRVLSSCHMYALVHQTVACMLRPAEVTREIAYTTVNTLSFCARAMAVHVSDFVEAATGYYCGISATSISSPPLPRRLPVPLLERLVPPLLQLINSPLLDLLSVMQHVPVEATNEVWQWHCPSSSIPPVQMLPASMDPNAAGAEVAMQVSRWADGGGLLEDVCRGVHAGVWVRGWVAGWLGRGR